MHCSCPAGGYRLDSRGLRWLGVLAIASIGCGHHHVVHAPGEVWLDKIEIHGNKTIPESDLIPGLSLSRALRDGQMVDPYQLSLDTKRIKSEYLRQGFFEAKVDGDIKREDNAQTVVFTVVEGPRSKARVNVTGLPPELPEQAVLDKLELKEGAPFDYELYDDGKEVVKQMVEEVGYPFVDLDESVVTVDKQARVAVASYRVVLSGPRATFGKVIVSGLENHPDLEHAVRGRLFFREGDIYTPKALTDTTRALYDLGRFSQVRIDIDRTTPQAVVPVTIAVSLAGQVELKAGGGLGADPLFVTYEARLRGGFSYVPDEYPLWTISADARLAATVDKDFENIEPKLRIFLNGQRLELLRPFIIGNAGVGLDVFTVEAYTAYGPLLRLGVTAPLGARWAKLDVGWNFSYLAFSGISDLIDPVTVFKLGLRGTERNGRYEQAVSVDLRDKPLEPRKGFYGALRFTEGTIAAGGAFDYFELQPDLRGYLPIGKQSALAFHLRAGAFFGEVPVTQRFFSGGAQNHRGFSARALAPSVCGTAPVEGMPQPASFVCSAGSTAAMGAQDSVLIGGKALLETGAELRIPLGTLSSTVSYGTTLFLDGGDVTNALSDLDPLNLYWAAGFGVYLKLGGFKIRIDVGRRINRLGADDLHESGELIKNTKFYLGVGETY